MFHRWSMKIAAQVVWFQDSQSSCQRLASCSSFGQKRKCSWVRWRISQGLSLMHRALLAPYYYIGIRLQRGYWLLTLLSQSRRQEGYSSSGLQPITVEHPMACGIAWSLSHFLLGSRWIPEQSLTQVLKIRVLEIFSSVNFKELTNFLQWFVDGAASHPANQKGFREAVKNGRLYRQKKEVTSKKWIVSGKVIFFGVSRSPSGDLLL